MMWEAQLGRAAINAGRGLRRRIEYVGGPPEANGIDSVCLRSPGSIVGSLGDGPTGGSVVVSSSKIRKFADADAGVR